MCQNQSHLTRAQHSAIDVRAFNSKCGNISSLKGSREDVGQLADFEGEGQSSSLLGKQPSGEGIQIVVDEHIDMCNNGSTGNQQQSLIKQKHHQQHLQHAPPQQQPLAEKHFQYQQRSPNLSQQQYQSSSCKYSSNS